MSSRVSEIVTIKQHGTVPIISHVPAYAWRCNECGWIGTGHTSERVAEREAADHAWADHGVAACLGAGVGAPHAWKRVPGTDSTDQCERCSAWCGK